MVTRANSRLLLLVTIIWLSLDPFPGWARVMESDPQGFLGLDWGISLANRSDFVPIESDDRLNTYALKNGQAEIEGIPVESVKFHTIDGHFGQITIHYRGEETHQSIVNLLESQFGKIELLPGSMMRGLNQQYTWRGTETEITITYRGLGQRGFLAAESRMLAPAFMDAISDQQF